MLQTGPSPALVRQLGYLRAEGVEIIQLGSQNLYYAGVVYRCISVHKEVPKARHSLKALDRTGFDEFVLTQHPKDISCIRARPQAFGGDDVLAGIDTRLYGYDESVLYGGHHVRVRPEILLGDA